MNGIIVIDKPISKSSYWVVNQTSKLLKKVKIGHTGTLDPLATGVLPVCLGEATKLSSFLMDGKKEYEVTAKLGERTDTLDSEGKIIERGTRNIDELNEQEIITELLHFKGNIVQIPPMYSAVKQGGKKLYELARKGIEVKRKERIVTVTDIEFYGYEPPYVSFRLECSKGTYVRSIVDSLGDSLGTFAHVSQLRRTKSSIFSLDDSIVIDNDFDLKKIRSSLISMETVVKRLMPVIEIDIDMARRVAKGYQLNFKELKERYNILQELPENRLFALFAKPVNEKEAVLLSVSKMMIENYTDMLSLTLENKILKTSRVFNYNKFMD